MSLVSVPLIPRKTAVNIVILFSCKAAFVNKCLKLGVDSHGRYCLSLSLIALLLNNIPVAAKLRRNITIAAIFVNQFMGERVNENNQLVAT